MTQTPHKPKPQKAKDFKSDRCQACEAGPPKLCHRCKGKIDKALKLTKAERKQY